MMLEVSTQSCLVTRVGAVSKCSAVRLRVKDLELKFVLDFCHE